MKTTKKLLSVLLAALLLALTLSCLSAGFTASAVAKGDKIQFGTYPQTKVKETTELKNAANAAVWRYYDYYIGFVPENFMQYADFVVGGVKYRAVKFSKYRPRDTRNTSGAEYSNQDENGYVPNTTYYFKYEPLTWRVLDPSAGLVICESAIDTQAYQNQNSSFDTDGDGVDEHYACYLDSDEGDHFFANNYKLSSIRRWLNCDFFETAFNDAQKAKIKYTTINNNAISSDYPQYNSDATTDRIYLLSYDEATSYNYGLNASYARTAQGTDYAKCQGLQQIENSANVYWTLRTAGRYSYKICIVKNDGQINAAWNTSTGDLGIRPACRLTSLADDTSQYLGRRNVIVKAEPAEGGAVTGTGTYDIGTSVTFTAAPNPGYHFVGWYNLGKEVGTENPIKFSVGNASMDDIVLTAKFEKDAAPDQPGGGNNPTQQQQSGACAYCGGTHTGFPGVLIGIIHSLLALFGLHK